MRKLKLTVINGIPDESFSEHEASLEEMVQELRKVNEVSLYKVRDMKIAYCCGCFDCWIKTPGLCVIKDDMETILRSTIHSDYVIYVSPLKAGFITSQTKKVIERQ
ncbi:MAG TPA: flavodoxin family protein, partial [Negativicutes bacterium]|nr:flavodoxin family protein [Negativicutes bacterium]